MKRSMLRFSILLTLILSLVTVRGVQAQKTEADSTVTVYHQLQHLLKNDVLSFGVLLQPQAEVHWNPQTEGQNTFRLGTARFKVYGNPTEHFTYVLQTDVTGTLQFSMPTSVI